MTVIHDYKKIKEIIKIQETKKHINITTNTIHHNPNWIKNILGQKNNRSIFATKDMSSEAITNTPAKS